MTGVNPAQYGAWASELLGERRVMPLGPGEPNGAMSEKLGAMKPKNLFEGKAIRDMDMARACIAGLWLYHDFLEESHAVSQMIPTPTGSYWHAIMHRREPDYDNAKYWFRRVGQHPVYDLLKEEAAKIGIAPSWDAFKFVDACESVSRIGGDAEQACREIQMKEWWALFDYSFHHAVAE